MDNREQIRALIWDLGGVILRTEDLSFREKWERRFDLGAWELEKTVFRSEMSKLASIGKASTEDIWTSVQQQLGLSEAEIEELRDDFFAGDRVDEDLMDFIRKLKGQYKIGMISNAWPDIREWMVEEAKIADAFDDIVLSSEVGIVKPASAIYQLSLDGLGVEAEQSIFIDDFIENIDGAKAVGMHGILFHDPEEFMHKLKQRLEIND